MSAWLYIRLARPVSLLLAAGAILFILAIVTEPLWRGMAAETPISREVR